MTIEARDVTQTLAENWSRYDGNLIRYLDRHFPSIQYEHENVIGHAFEAVIRRAEHIAKIYDGVRPLKSYIEAFLTTCVKNGARDAMRTAGKRVDMAERSALEEDGESEGLAVLPHVMVFGDQEEIVWLKQMIESLGDLNIVERARLRRTWDRADLSEMLSRQRSLVDLGTSMKTQTPLQFAMECKAVMELVENGYSELKQSK